MAKFKGERKKEDITIKTFRIKSKYAKILEAQARREGITVSGVLDLVLKKWNTPKKMETSVLTGA